MIGKIMPIVSLVRFAWKAVLRPMVAKAIDDPNEVWDDELMVILDRIFDALAEN